MRAGLTSVLSKYSALLPGIYSIAQTFSVCVCVCVVETCRYFSSKQARSHVNVFDETRQMFIVDHCVLFSSYFHADLRL